VVADVITGEATMNTYPVRDGANRTYAFEIENAYISRMKAASLVRSVGGVSDVRVRRLFGSDPDVHIKFAYKGQAFMVWEPYGDSSRFWIGPEDELQVHVNISTLEAVFREYRPPILARILGNLVSLRFLFQTFKWLKSRC
jgi:hypothetical protein